MKTSPTALRTFWYMGAKTRLIPEFLDGAVRDLVDDGSTILDVCAGTGIVARSAATTHRVFANDVQRFSAIVASAHLEGDAKWMNEIDQLDPELDLEALTASHRSDLEGLLGPALRVEDQRLEALKRDPSDQSADAYRAFIAATPIPDLQLEQEHASVSEDSLDDETLQAFAMWRERLPGLLRVRHDDPKTRPYLLTTAYYGNVYFGLRQAIEIDSIRYAIDNIPESDPFRESKQALYLGALVHAVSISTSGTSHFAQPRSGAKRSELDAIATRRRMDIDLEFYRALDAIRREWMDHPRLGGNRVFSKPAEELLGEETTPFEKGDVDLIYLDPPYTSDHYSRFYHVLETLCDYDYPELERRGGGLTRGRYPLRERRFASDFCSAERVENAFRTVAERCHALGAKLLVSYSPDNGLLFKHWKNADLVRFAAIFKEFFASVEIREREIMHSGQGDSNRRVRELLVLCEG